MPLGPGKYDNALTRARKSCGATDAVLIVLNGSLGPGFSVQATLGATLVLPATLRAVADQIEASFKAGKL